MTGLVNVKYGHLAKLRRISLNECGHPVPDTAGVEGARRIAEIASAAERDDSNTGRSSPVEPRH